MRKRLIELLKKASYGMLVNHEREEIADALLSEGVIVPPVKVGQEIYYIDKCFDEILDGTIENIVYNGKEFYGDCVLTIFEGSGELWEWTTSSIGTDIFLAREEAEKALAEREEK